MGVRLLYSVSDCDSEHSPVVDDLLVSETARKMAPIIIAINEPRTMDEITQQGVHIQQAVAHFL